MAEPENIFPQDTPDASILAARTLASSTSATSHRVSSDEVSATSTSTATLHGYRSFPSTLPGAVPSPTDPLAAMVTALRRCFQLEFEVWNAVDRQRLSPGLALMPGESLLESSSLLAQIPGDSPCQVLALSPQVGLLLVPLYGCGRSEQIAVAPVLLAHALESNLPSDEDLMATGLELTAFQNWAAGRDRWSERQLLQIASHFHRDWQTQRETQALNLTIEDLSEKISTTYEEITLLYSLTENLKITRSDRQLASLCLDGALECIPAESIAIQLLPPNGSAEANFDVRREVELLTEGPFPLDNLQLSLLLHTLEIDQHSRPIIANTPVTSSRAWPFPGVRQVVVAPLREGENRFGYIALVNHKRDREFGSVEAHLLGSMATILGIHLGNLEHYRQHKELLASVVRTLTTAIEVKDPYTCGHSERVAKVAVLLAKELGCDPQQLQTLYMGGLLHDVGKIGIDDSILRKPDRLTDAEFEHIRLHPTLGYNILADVKQFAELLPIVLHHHEQYDGKGYPSQLVGEQTPWLARITAVADAYDAMTSDRPYRKGMPHEKVKEIFAKGYGQQWDAKVLDAFLRIESEIRTAVSVDREQLPLNVKKWLPE